jgi:hypothetical protein
MVGRTPGRLASFLSTLKRTSQICATILDEMHYYRRLPHIWTRGQPIFLAWRLHGSLPPHRVFPGGTIASGRAFAALDRLLDEARTGPFHLCQPALADMVRDAVFYNSDAQALCAAFLCGDAQPCSSPADSRGSLAAINEIAKRHNSQARQRDAGIEGKSLLAGREL